MAFCHLQLRAMCFPRSELGLLPGVSREESQLFSLN